MHRSGGVVVGKYKIFAFITISGIIADQVTKIYIDKSMKLFDSIAVIPNLFSITYLRNKGAAFSFLSNASWRLPFFIGISMVALIAIILFYRKIEESQKLPQIGLSMIFSGAIGNLIDRVRMGEVIDFLDVYWKSHHWPAFNVADSLICVGVGFMLLDTLFEGKRGE